MSNFSIQSVGTLCKLNYHNNNCLYILTFRQCVLIILKFLISSYVSYRVFNCILVYFIPLPVFIFYSFFFFILFYLLFFHVHCTGLFSFSFSLFLFYFCLLVFLVLCTSVDGTVPAWVGLYRVVSLCVRVCLCADVLSLSCVCQCVTILCG